MPHSQYLFLAVSFQSQSRTMFSMSPCHSYATLLFTFVLSSYTHCHAFLSMPNYPFNIALSVQSHNFCLHALPRCLFKVALTFLCSFSHNVTLLDEDASVQSTQHVPEYLANGSHRVSGSEYAGKIHATTLALHPCLCALPPGVHTHAYIMHQSEITHM